MSRDQVTKDSQARARPHQRDTWGRSTGTWGRTWVAPGVAHLGSNMLSYHMGGLRK